MSTAVLSCWPLESMIRRTVRTGFFLLTFLGLLVFRRVTENVRLIVITMMSHDCWREDKRVRNILVEAVCGGIDEHRVKDGVGRVLTTGHSERYGLEAQVDNLMKARRLAVHCHLSEQRYCLPESRSYLQWGVEGTEGGRAIEGFARVPGPCQPMYKLAGAKYAP